MARFRTSGTFAGKGQPDLVARAESLMQMGEPEPPRNPHHPHLYSRTAIVAAERRRGVVWLGKQKRHAPAAD